MGVMNATSVRAALAASLCASLLAISAAPPARAQVRRPVPPAACVTKTQINPKEPGWAFVVNFDVFDAEGAPEGCLIVWRTVLFPTDYAVRPCKVVGVFPEIGFADGKAAFNGGHVRCDVNIKASLAALTPTLTVSDTERYSFFTIIGAGTLTDSNRITDTANPIGYYEPANPASPPAGLFVPIGANGGALVTRVNSETVRGGFLNAGVLTFGKSYTFTMEHDRVPGGRPGDIALSHYVDLTRVDVVSPTAPVEFWTDGGTFYIGASTITTTSRLFGNFDEVIFDPPDGGRPPASARMIFELFLPVLSR
jgi:hypothetical protein